MQTHTHIQNGNNNNKHFQMCRFMKQCSSSIQYLQVDIIMQTHTYTFSNMQIHVKANYPFL